MPNNTQHKKSHKGHADSNLCRCRCTRKRMPSTTSAELLSWSGGATQAATAGLKKGYPMVPHSILWYIKPLIFPIAVANKNWGSHGKSPMSIATPSFPLFIVEQIPLDPIKSPRKNPSKDFATEPQVPATPLLCRQSRNAATWSLQLSTSWRKAAIRPCEASQGDEAMEVQRGQWWGKSMKYDAIMGNIWGIWLGICNHIDMDIIWYYGEWSGFVGEHLGFFNQSLTIKLIGVSGSDETQKTWWCWDDVDDANGPSKIHQMVGLGYPLFSDSPTVYQSEINHHGST